MRLQQGEWHIEETPDGWQLHLRRRLSPLRYAPSRLPDWSRFVFWFLLLVTAGAAASIAAGYRQYASLSLGLLLLTLWLPVVWFVPHRWSPIIGTSYVEAVRAIRVRIREGRFDVPHGQFDEDVLRTLRIDAAGCMSGLVALIFDGHVEKAVPLVGWPGVDPAMAEAVRQAVQTRSRADADRQRALTSAST